MVEDLDYLGCLYISSSGQLNIEIVIFL
jgi:hypothetical protein